jgi:hypothetical protein
MFSQPMQVITETPAKKINHYHRLHDDTNNNLSNFYTI